MLGHNRHARHVLLCPGRSAFGGGKIVKEFAFTVLGGILVGTLTSVYVGQCHSLAIAILGGALFGSLTHNFKLICEIVQLESTLRGEGTHALP